MSTKEEEMSTSLAVAPPVYEPPTLEWRGETAQVVAAVWWAIVIGWSLTLALAYAAYCTWAGGEPHIYVTWKGFKVVCER